MHFEISKNDFQELSREIQAILKDLSWFDRYGMEWVKLGLRFLLFALGWAVFAIPVHGAFQLLGITMMSYAYIGICITGIHEASHQSLAISRRANRFWAIFFTDFWTSKSHIWWRWRHVETHHPHTNVVGEEPQPFYVPWMHKYLYFFVLPYVVVPWLFSSSLWHLRKRPKDLLQFVIIAILGYAFQASLFGVLGYSLGWSLFLVLVMRSIFAPIFLHLAVFNHIGLPYFDNDSSRPGWTELQTKTTRNIRPNWFLKGIGGNAFLDGHVEHHLFPSLSNHVIHRLRETIVIFLKKKGYLYREESYLACLRACLKHYAQIFDVLRQPLW